MAIRLDAVGESSYIAGNPGLSNLTIAGWVQLVVDLNTTGPFLQVTDGSTYFTLGVNSDGTSLRLFGGAAALGTNLTVGTWYHAALVRSGTDIYAYLNGALDITSTTAQSFTPAYVVFGSTGSPRVNGRLAGWKIWSATLTQAEIQAEMYRYLPRRTANLWAWYPMLPGATERVRDYSGNGRGLTETGTVSDEDGPPISWGAPVLYVNQPNPAPAGGQPMAKRILTVPHLAGSRRIGAF